MAMLVSCQRSIKEPESRPISLRWADGKPIEVFIDKEVISGRNGDVSKFSIRLQGKEVEVLGDFYLTPKSLAFRPLVPFDVNQTYVLVTEGSEIVRFQAKRSLNDSLYDPPRLIGIYPNVDTIPENLLKMHLVFDRPMEQNASNEFISVLTENGDSLEHVFLALEPELWNHDRTVLTLWLEPGRVKEGLIPNRELGPPLTAGQKVQFQIDGGWRSAEGVALGAESVRSYVVSERDQDMPKVDQWVINVPKAQSLEPLEIIFNETMDFVLVAECIQVYGPAEAYIEGTIKVGRDASMAWFYPVNTWLNGVYAIMIESRFEDLAGNNLNRPFDKDLTLPINDNDQQHHKKMITVR